MIPSNLSALVLEELRERSRSPFHIVGERCPFLLRYTPIEINSILGEDDYNGIEKKETNGTDATQELV